MQAKTTLETTKTTAEPAKKDKKLADKIKRIQDDITVLEKRLQDLKDLHSAIGGTITEAQAKELILQKHHNHILEQLNRYLNAEKRALIQAFENLWDKYALPADTLEQQRNQTMQTLREYLQKLEYVA